MNEKRNVENFKLINNSDTRTELIEMVAKRLIKDKKIPQFYLICQMRKHDGLTITNIDKPLIIISVRNIVQFENVFAHEVVHLMQHQNGYANEDFDKRIVVTS